MITLINSKGVKMNIQILDEIKSLIQNKNSKWLSLKDAVDYSGLSDSTIRRAIQSGQLKANKVGGKWLVKSEWIERYLTR